MSDSYQDDDDRDAADPGYDPDVGPTPEMWPQGLQAHRVMGTGRPLAECARSFAERLPALLSTSPFCWDYGEDPPEEVRLDAASLRARIGPGGLLLGDRPSDPTHLLVVDRSASENRAWFSLGLPGPRQPQLLPLPGMCALVEAAATELDGYVAFTDDSALGHMYAGRRHIDRTNRQLASLGMTPDQTFQPIAGVAGEIPELLTRAEFRDDLVPEGVFWINWWNPQMVAELGRERIVNAGWEQVIAHHDGAMTLVATLEPPDLTSARDVARLRGLVEALDLRGAQEHHRIQEM